MLNLTDKSKLLEVAFFQDGCCSWYEFQQGAMFVEDVDSVVGYTRAYEDTIVLKYV